MGRGFRGRRAVAAALVGLFGLVVISGPATAHAGSLNLSSEPSPIPNWVYAMTGGGVVAISFLFTSLVTDPELVHWLRGRDWRLPTEAGPLVGRIGSVLGVLVLGAVLVLGFVGPTQPLANAAVLLVWVMWWAGYTTSVYLVGNTWPWLNPWRTITSLLPSGTMSYPVGLGLWPAVAGLLGLVFVEVVTPLADEPRLLATIVLGYTIVTLVGAVLVGPETWFGSVDPVSRVFHYYGQIAPLQWDGGPRLHPPSAVLNRADLLEGFDEVAFVITMLWVTTYDGLVSTPTGAGMIEVAVSVGIPPLAAYFAILVLGFGVFLGAYWAGAVGIRRVGGTFVTRGEIARRFAPTLLPIAAGYHLAHFLAYFLELLPALVSSLANPLTAPVSVPVLSVPGWFGGVELGFVVLGHVVAVWAAHGTAFDLFSGRIQPIRSQYPLVVLMIAYTVTSLWVIAQPFSAPAYV